MDRLFIHNCMAARTLAAAPADLLRTSLDEMIGRTPPKNSYAPAELGGFMFGPTGAAYLLLQLSARCPGLYVGGHDMRSWATKYLDGERGPLVLSDGRAGIISEKLAFTAVRACLSKDQAYVRALLDDIQQLLEVRPGDAHERFPAEWLYGRAGVLYLLRMVRHWVPESASLVDTPMLELAQRTVDMDDDGQGHWLSRGARCLGAAHGDIGSIVQIVLSAPCLARRLDGALSELLDFQTPSGNWMQTSSVKDESQGQVQFCHGAPGFVYALQSLRRHFPQLQQRIDGAIGRARSLVWNKGLLKKEPSLCHGHFGNGLVLAKGQQREHFLAQATPEAVEASRRDEATMFEPAHYGHELSVLMGYWPSAVWTWLVCDEEEPPLILFNDV